MASELIALGGAALAAGLLARAGRRFGLPTIPFFMAAGIILGPHTPGIVLVQEPEDLELIAAIGLILLLFHLGVEFPVQQILSSGKRLLLAAGGYLALNMGAGLALGFALGWGASEALVVAGAVGISSSAIVTKLLIELRRLTNRETPVILGIIVVEDLFLAFYLALLSPFLSGSASTGAVIRDFGISFGFLVVLLVVARFGARVIGKMLGSEEDELLTVLFVGLAILVAGMSASLGVSDAIGALLIGLVVSQTTVKERVERLVLPLRDAFAAIFFVVFGLTININAIGSVLVPVVLAVCLSLVMNVLAGILAARIYQFDARAAANIGLTVLGRGEFSLILATLALTAGLDSRIGPFVGLYVLVLAVVSPLLASQSSHLARLMPGWLFNPLPSLRPRGRSGQAD
jgi:monovalent cation:H+ antiporter-2, CPA2 family